MRHLVPQELPALRFARARVDLLQLAVDTIQTRRRCERIEVAGQPEVRARCDQRIDLRCGEVLQQRRNEVKKP